MCGSLARRVSCETEHLILKNMNPKEKNAFLPRKGTLIFDALHDLVPLKQYKKCGKHPWRSVTFSKVEGFSLKSITPPWVIFTFFK